MCLMNDVLGLVCWCVVLNVGGANGIVSGSPCFHLYFASDLKCGLEPFIRSISGVGL